MMHSTVRLALFTVQTVIREHDCILLLSTHDSAIYKLPSPSMYPQVSACGLVQLRVC